MLTKMKIISESSIATFRHLHTADKLVDKCHGKSSSRIWCRDDIMEHRTDRHWRFRIYGRRRRWVVNPQYLNHGDWSFQTMGVPPDIWDCRHWMLQSIWVYDGTNIRSLGVYILYDTFNFMWTNIKDNLLRLF